MHFTCQPPLGDVKNYTHLPIFILFFQYVPHVLLIHFFFRLFSFSHFFPSFFTLIHGPLRSPLCGGSRRSVRKQQRAWVWGGFRFLLFLGLNYNSSMLLLVGPFALFGLLPAVYLRACLPSWKVHVTLFIKVIILLGVALSLPRFLLFPSSSSFGSNRGTLCSRVQSSWSRRRCSFTDNI